jgi:ArsR family transcriptional regulator
MGSLDETVGLLGLMGDPTRVRLMALLDREELAVTELVAVTELSQSRISTHLGRLKEAGLLRDRRVGTSTRYARNDSMSQAAVQLWQTVRQELSDSVLDADRSRAQELKLARERSAAWPDSIAGEMERHYSPGRTWEATARGLLAFIQLGEVLDIGAGDGVMAQLLAPRARSITCLDRSERMIQAARSRLAALPNVRFSLGDMHQLPFDAASFDQAMLLNSLTYAEAPTAALTEAARVLRPGGTLALVTLNAHEHAGVTRSYGHLHAGFRPADLAQLLATAGLEVVHCAVTSRERRKPYLEVVSAAARNPNR